MSEVRRRGRRAWQGALLCCVLTTLAAGQAHALRLSHERVGVAAAARSLQIREPQGQFVSAVLGAPNALRLPADLASQGLLSAFLAVSTVEPTASTPLQFKPSGSFDAWQVALKAVMVGALGIAAVIGGLYAWKNWKGLPQLSRLTTPDPRAAVVESARRISPRSTLFVVRWEGRRYLLSESTTQTVVVDSRAAEEPTA